MVFVGLRADQIVAATVDLIEITFVVQRKLGGLILELAMLIDKVAVFEQQARLDDH